METHEYHNARATPHGAYGDGSEGNREAAKKISPEVVQSCHLFANPPNPRVGDRNVNKFSTRPRTSPHRSASLDLEDLFIYPAMQALSLLGRRETRRLVHKLPGSDQLGRFPL